MSLSLCLLGLDEPILARRLSFPAMERPGMLARGRKPAGVIATLLLGWSTLALSLVWGYQLARRVFDERDRLSLVAVSLGLGLVTLVFSGAYLRRWLEPETLPIATLSLLGLAIFGLKRRPAPDLSNEPLSLASRLFLLLGCPVVLIYALFELSTGMVIDGDFFVHVASIGLFESGHYPPLNYFLGIPTGGHFGRQLLIAQFARFSGLPFLTADWVLTTCLMLLTFLLLFCLLREHTQSQNQAVLGTGMAFFAANTGSRIGLVDTLGNHNPVAFFMLIMVTWAVLRSLRVGGVSLVVAAAVLGCEAMVYETHFGLVGLTMPLVILTVPSAQKKLVIPRILTVGLLALVVAATIGGAFTDLASRNSSAGEAKQQQVSVKIPKSELFMLRTDNMRPSRPFEGKMRAWRADFSPSQDYAFALGTKIRDLFWYPTWLFPLAFLFCLVRGQRIGVWFGGLAISAWFIPSVVDFGFFEGEALRWLFVTAVGGSVVFGVVVGDLWDRSPKRWWSGLLLTLVVWFSCAGMIRSVPDMVWALAHPGEELPIGRPGIVPGVGLIPDPYRSLASHYKLTEDDFQAADWLEKNTPNGSHLLADDDESSVNARCTMFGLTGRLPSGYLPQVTDSTEPSGYRRRLQIDEFWATGDARLLAGLGVDWLMVHSDRRSEDVLQRLDKEPGLKRVQSFGKVRIYSCQLDEPSAPVEPLQVDSVLSSRVDPDAVLLTVRAHHTAKEPLEWITLGLFDQTGRLVGGPQWRPIDLWKAGERELKLTFWRPYEEGRYKLRIWGGRAVGNEPGTDMPGFEVEERASGP